MTLLLLVGVAWILLAVTARGVEGQGTVRSAHMVVDLSGAGSEARVRLEYLLDGVPEGRPLGLSVLRFGAARVAEVRAGEEAVALRALPGVAAAATVTAVATDAPGSARVVLSYEVTNPVTAHEDQALRGYLPVLTLDLPPEEARPGLFQAELILPGSWRLSDAFPTGLAPTAADGEAGRWAVDLPVVPSVVSFRAHLDGRWHAGLPLILDLLAGAILLLFASLGWKHLRQVAR
ncbi:MAG: hypothetical protein LJF04_18765 [Gemmatimonadetes bacterium]|nr:hypothetical protein [Gemmatimonadota bacterium]